MILSFKDRRSVVLYKRAYTALRLSHAAMIRGESSDYAAHYALELRRSECAEALPAPLVAAVERSIDRAFGFPLESDDDAAQQENRAANNKTA
jgi:hypothetical protein